jgi:SAM-dependent methyltransferase
MNIADIAEKIIPIQELPAWSPWPMRICGLASWNIPSRTEEKVNGEYDKNEYLRCLAFAKENPGISPENVRAFEMRVQDRKSICVSQKEMLYELSTAKLLSVDADLLLEVIQPFMEEVDAIVELGCGYGINLWEINKRYPEKTYIGGEYSQNAIALAELLYAGHPNMRFEAFNYYAPSYGIFDQCKSKKTLVLTRHSIEQIPSAAPFVQGVTQYLDRIVIGVHLEIVRENHGTSLLGLMRERYILLNDYNRDILSQLKSHPKIEVLRNDPDVYGISPLNPTSVVVWKPR